MTSTLKRDTIDIFFDFLEFHTEHLMMRRSEITGMPEPHYRLLYYLDSTSMVPMKDLGDLMHVSKTYITKIVDALSLEKFVERHPDAQDRRIIHIMITKKGKKRIKEARELIKKEIRKELSVLTPHDYETIIRSLDSFLSVVLNYSDIYERNE